MTAFFLQLNYIRYVFPNFYLMHIINFFLFKLRKISIYAKKNIDNVGNFLK